MRPKTEKSPLAFRTISEVSKELEIPTHVLRFWETKFNKIQPLKRSGNRRYYRPNDIILIKSIKKYLYEDGYTVKGVQKLLEGHINNSNENTIPKNLNSENDEFVNSNKNNDQLKKDLKNLLNDIDDLIDKI